MNIRTTIAHPVMEIVALLVFPVFIMWVVPLIFADRRARAEVSLVLSVAALGFAAALNVYHREGFRDLGFRLDNFPQAWRQVSWFTLAGSALLLAIGRQTNGLHFGIRFVYQLIAVPIWALQQHYGIQGIINRRWCAAIGSGRWSVLLTAAIFGALHLPNPTLTIATFISGLVWSRGFQRAPNLPAIAVSHSILSAMIAGSLPAGLLPNMKVGWGYWNL